MRAHDLREVLAERGFRLLVGTRLVAQAADGVLEVGLASYVLFSPERQASGARIAASFAVLLLPYSVVGPFLGVLIDRWRRRQILVVANLLRAALVVVVAVLAGHGSTGALFVAVALTVLGVNRFILAALSAALPHVVQPGRLVTANAVATTAGAVATAIGVGAGLAARFLAGSGDTAAAGIIVVASLGYLLASLVATRLGSDTLGPDLTGGRPPLDLRGELKALTSGVRYLYSRRPAWNALAVLGFFRVTFGLMTVAIVLLQRATFHAPSDADGGLRGVSIAAGALALGIPVGAAMTPGAVRRWGAGWWVPAVMVSAGVALAVLTLPFHQAPVVAAAFVLGVGAQAVKVSVDSTVQRTVDDQHRGLVFALYDTVFNVAFVIAVGIAAWLLPSSGRSVPLVLLAAAVLVVAGLWYARVTPRTPREVRGVDAVAVPPPQPRSPQPGPPDAESRTRPPARPARP